VLGYGQPAQALLAMLILPMEATCPPGKWGDMVSTVLTPVGCWGLHLSGNQGKTQRELSGKHSQVSLFPLSPKCKAEQSSLTSFCRQQSFFFGVTNSKMGNLWNYSCFPYTSTHVSQEKG